MEIKKETVDYIANLSRLKFNNEQSTKIANHMGDILTYMDKLNSLNTEGIKPMEHVKPISNVFRDDIISPSYDREQLLENAPLKEEGAFVVPKVVE